MLDSRCKPCADVSIAAFLDEGPFFVEGERDHEGSELALSDQFRQAFKRVLHGRAFLDVLVKSGEALGQRFKLGIDLFFNGDGHAAPRLRRYSSTDTRRPASAAPNVPSP